MAKKAPGKVNPALEQAIAAELAAVQEKGEDGKFLHSTTERMKVIDRALKLETIKAKIPDNEMGSGFK